MILTIQNRRKAAGMTMQELADRVGVSRAAVFRWEAGDALPQADKLPEISAALGCTIDDLFHDYKATEEIRP